jgi:uncharacterized ubiquitin-like protein YukD
MKNKHTTPSECMDWRERFDSLRVEYFSEDMGHPYDEPLSISEEDEKVIKSFIQSLLIEERSKRDEQWIKAMGKDIEISKDDNFCLQSMIVARNELRKEILNKLQINNK